MKKPIILSIVTVCVLAMTPAAQAQFSTYRTTNDFFNALNSANYYTESFASLPSGTGNPNPLNFTNNPYGFQALLPPGGGNISVESYDGKPALATIFTAQSLSFTNFSPNTRAFGAFLYATDGVVLTQPITISLLLSSGPATNFTTNVGTTSVNDYFFGFITDDPLAIQSVTLSVTNNLAFPTASEVTISTVPEPSTYALLSLAAVGLAGYLIRRRRA